MTQSETNTLRQDGSMAAQGGDRREGAMERHTEEGEEKESLMSFCSFLSLLSEAWPYVKHPHQNGLSCALLRIFSAVGNCSGGMSPSFI